ncbi:Oxygen sensor protein DosP [compost metagenome]
MIRIGDSLNLTVIAEGVETEAQRFLLDAQGCKVGQGYLFSQPLPPELLADWLKTSTVAL